MSPFQPLDAFEVDGDALVWLRASSGVLSVLGAGTALLGLLFGVGGALRLLREGSALGGLFAALGVSMVAFGVFLAFLRVEVRVDGAGARRTSRALVPLSAERIARADCTAVVLRAGTVGMVRAGPQAPGSRLETTSLQLEVGPVGAERTFGLATELDGPSTEASARRAAEAVAQRLGVPFVDQRAQAQRPPDTTVPLGSWAARLLGASLALVLGLAVLGALVLPAPKGRERAAPHGRP